MRRKAHGVRFSSLGERQSLLGKTKLARRMAKLARKGKIALGMAKSAREMRSSRGRQSSRGENPGSRGERKNLLEGTSSSLGERRNLGEEWRNSRAAGKAPPFEFLPLLSTCPLGGHATPWFTAPWISAPLASLFLDFFHPLNSCPHFFDSRHCRF